MNIEVFNRNISLSKLGIAELDSEEKDIYDFLMYKFYKLDIYLHHNNSDTYYFINEIRRIVFVYRFTSNYMWISRDVWEQFSLKVPLGYRQSILYYWLKKNFDIEPMTREIIDDEIILDNNFTILKK